LSALPQSLQYAAIHTTADEDHLEAIPAAYEGNKFISNICDIAGRGAWTWRSPQSKSLETLQGEAVRLLGRVPYSALGNIEFLTIREEGGDRDRGEKGWGCPGGVVGSAPMAKHRRAIPSASSSLV
jgi:hypothetical protein